MIKDRIIQLIEYKGIAKERFFEKIGVTSANFRGKAKNSDVNSQTIAKIFTEIPDVNIEWLLTGIGDMFKVQTEKKEDFEDMYYKLLKKYSELSDEYREFQKEQNKSKNKNIKSAYTNKS